MRGKLFLLLLSVASIALVQAAPTVTLTASPTSGISPLSVVLTWTSTGASVCTASGGWSGTKALNGTQTMASVLTSKTYTLTCAEGNGTAKATWVAPTLNTDGSALTNLAGFKLYYANTAAGVPTATPVTINDKLATTYTVTGLAAGTWYFGMKAFTTAGIDSVMSAQATKVVSLASAVASASVTVNTQPQPPVLTVDTVVRRWGPTLNKPRQYAGTVDLGEVCGSLKKRVDGPDWYVIARDKVDLNSYGQNLPQSTTFVAKCS
jgi:hypothetical protein